MDDPITNQQLPSLRALGDKFALDGLRILAFPTDQGYYEPDVSEMVRLKAFQSYGFGQYPYSVVFDKVDVMGRTAHPLFKYLNAALPNPNGVARLTLNFEKILLDESGVPLRRYPRKYTGYQLERDVEALLVEGKLPPPSPSFATAWEEAEREAQKGEYSFRENYNVYDQDTASTDWAGLAKLSFR